MPRHLAPALGGGAKIRQAVNVEEIRRRLAAGERRSGIARALGVTRAAVTMALQRAARRARGAEPPDPTPHLSRPTIAAPGAGDARETGLSDPSSSLLDRLRVTRPDLADLLAQHATLEEQAAVILVRVHCNRQAVEAMRALIPLKPVLAQLWGKPVGVVWQ